ncbi:MAG: CoA-transferase [candidate division NC10 bacterium]|nr:CoA-transferase [candidate division NC10 bacterium]
MPKADGAGGYTAGELMVVCAAREIRDGEVVFVGMRLPLLAFALAKRTHAPRAVGLFENGIVRDSAAATLLYTMGDGGNVAGALWCTRMADVMALLHQGAVDVGFIGGAQMDRFGNLNTSYVSAEGQGRHAGEPGREEAAAGGPAACGARGDAGRTGEGYRLGMKLPGSGGAADIAALAGRLLVIMQHERRRFIPRVDYVTSPGYGDGGDWRARVGLPRGGPAAAITTLGVLRFRPDTREAYLASYHPGTSVAEVRGNSGWDLLVAEGVRETPPPAPEELRIIREYDPDGFWTR